MKSDRLPVTGNSCPKRFKRQFNLTRHERDKHLLELIVDEERPFACNSTAVRVVQKDNSTWRGMIEPNI